MKLKFILYPLLSALLLSISWFSPFTGFIFIAWVPLFILEEDISKSDGLKHKNLKLLWLSYLSFFVWNLCVTWWIYFASFGGACMAIICNAFLMCFVFMIWHNLKKRLEKPWAIWLIIPFWLGYEYGHTLWDITWTWLTLGNAFAFTPNWVQWYEFTGTSGGSLWVLIVNILVFKLLQSGRFQIKQLAKPITAIIFPLLISYIILALAPSKSQHETKTYKTLLIQPNVDPYHDKFYTQPEVQLQMLLTQVKGRLDSTIDFLVMPETFLTENIFEGQEKESLSIQFLKDSLLAHYPKLTIVSGANTMYAFKPGETVTSTASQFNNANEYYESYNTGLQFNHEGIAFYHKSKLVPGVEKMPFPVLFKPLERFAIDLGGTMGSLGSQDERTVFFSHHKTVGIAPVICYESVYPDYVAEYVRNGANMIFILTNDGWWEDSPGHKQHMAYARLRAIETRKEIARCANTGISCFITPYGAVEQATPYWEKAIIIKNMTPNNIRTFFVAYGDLISYAASVIAILLFIGSQILRFRKS